MPRRRYEYGSEAIESRFCAAGGHHEVSAILKLSGRGYANWSKEAIVL